VDAAWDAVGGRGETAGGPALSSQHHIEKHAKFLAAGGLLVTEIAQNHGS
jgi:hypothetical protein